MINLRNTNLTFIFFWSNSGNTWQTWQHFLSQIFFGKKLHMFCSTLSPPEQTMRHNGNLGTYFWQKNKLKLAIGWLSRK